MKKYYAEFCGSFALLFAGCGAIVVDQMQGGRLGSMGIAFVFGFVVMAMIYALGDISGAHFNPAVSFGFWLAKRISWKEMLIYSLSQILGALSAILLLKIMFPFQASLGETLPAPGLVPQAFVAEIFLTALLMFVILSVSTGSKEKGLMAGLAIGSVVALAAMFAGPLSGASMNPARSLAPALLTAHTQFLWIYLLAPILGSGLAVLSCKLCQKEGCCA